MVGFSLSVTTTSKLIVVWFPAASSAVYVTVVVPTANASPLLWVDVKLVTPQLSPEVGSVQLTTALQRPPSLLAERSAWALMVGASSSVTVMVKVAVLELALASVAVKVTVVVPTGKVDPLG